PDNDNGETASFDFLVNDSDTNSVSAATMTINVGDINDAPVIVDDNVLSDEDLVITINPLANDFDVDGDPLTISNVTHGEHGVVTINPDNTINYQPDANYNGSDSFSYTVSDGNGGISTATVQVVINPINDAPVIVDDDVLTDEDLVIIINPLANDFDVDGDPLTISNVTQGKHGVVTINPDGSIKYIPDVNYSGLDSFSYAVSDGNGGFNVGEVNISVNFIDDEPVIDKNNNKNTQTLPETIGTIKYIVYDNKIIIQSLNFYTPERELVENIFAGDSQLNHFFGFEGSLEDIFDIREFEGDILSLINNAYSNFVIRVNDQIVSGKGSQFDPYKIYVSNDSEIYLMTLFQYYAMSIDVSGENVEEGSWYLKANVNENDMFFTLNPDYEGEVTLKIELSRESKFTEEVHFNINIGSDKNNLSNEGLNQQEYAALLPGENNLNHLWNTDPSRVMSRLQTDFTHALDSNQSLPIIENIVSRILSASSKLDDVNQSVDMILSRAAQAGMEQSDLSNLSVYMILNLENKNDRVEVVKAILNNENSNRETILNVYQLLLEENKEAAELFMKEATKQLSGDIGDDILQFGSISVINPGYLSALKESLLSDSEQEKFIQLDAKKKALIYQLEIERTKKYLLKLFGKG
ncbi:MAG: tandem-95 repeat protein, partial [Gammaproteobacteria bacterium]